ncbi:hypothetical protein JRI60_39255 [Archangium violaceum]|uniref:hypothetical protein n=1 Tax=Archangium violaceum TaxID=83451 RepID=UPI00194F230C|nr:hypothetical protein [Archangium violaceum]QRN95076.1 hypothetical protein JRI60_39255 [Archangium violaceum]
MADPESAPTRTDKRALSTQEVRLLRRVFAEGISYEPVRLVRMATIVARVNNSRAFVLGNTLHLPDAEYERFARGQNPSLLVHEATHLWQYQHHGWSYAVEALWAQGLGDGYDYVKALREGKPWRKMNPEQQAQLLQDAFRAGYFDVPETRFGVVGNAVAVIRSNRAPPQGYADYTPVLVEALEELRKPS